MSRLHLRRVMYNPNRAEVIQPTEEERRWTILSLQGGKTVGRGDINDVVLLDGSENVEREPPFISRCHAKFHHSQADGREVYHVEDRSENGTYLNDRRLPRTKQELLKAGDTIKFGHRNGSQHQPDQVVDNPSAEFAFRVEMSTEHDPVYKFVEQMRDSRVKVFSDNACSKMFALRESTSNKVLQQEADSTIGLSDNDANGSSKQRVTSVEEVQTPSTSRDLNTDPPKKAPHAKQFQTSMKEFVYNTSRFRGIYREALKQQAVRIVHSIGSLPPFFSTIQEMVDVNVANKCAYTLEGKLKFIDEFCSVNRNNSGVSQIEVVRNELAQVLINEEPETMKIRKLLNDLKASPQDTEAVIPSDTNAATSGFKPSTSSAFHAPTPVHPGIAHPKAVNVSSNQSAYIDYLRNMNMSKEDITKMKDERSKLYSFAPYVTQSLTQHFIPTGFAQLLQTVLENQEKQQKTLSPPDMFLGSLNRVMELHPTQNVTSQAVGVITSAGTPRQSSVHTNPSAEAIGADEERHSASSGSTDNGRRRTESEDEILDVVGTDEPITNFPKENGKIRSSSPPEASSSGSSVRNLAMDDELNSGGTQTPSPVLPDSEEVVRQFEAETQKKLEEASDVLRNSATPRIDAQSTPSAVVSALPTPMSSPLPRSVQTASAPIDEEDRSLKRSEGMTSTAKPKQDREAADKRKEENRLRKAEEKRQKEEDDMRQAREASEKAEKLAREIKEKADENEKRRKQEEAERSTPSVSSDVKKKSAPPARRMKQLDESSVDTDSDDDDKQGHQKKKIRRSTRTAKTSPSKKAPKPNVGDEEDDEKDDDEKDTSKVKRKQKGLKRSASQIALRKMAKDSDDQPKKKRGRKKLTPAPLDTEDDEKTEEGVQEVREVKEVKSKKISRKERCGVPLEYCMGIKYEKKKNLEWVSCSECYQWFHVWCVRLENKPYQKNETFYCCGPHANKEAKDALEGKVHGRYLSYPGRKPVPEDFEIKT